MSNLVKVRCSFKDCDGVQRVDVDSLSAEVECSTCNRKGRLIPLEETVVHDQQSTVISDQSTTSETPPQVKRRQQRKTIGGFELFKPLGRGAFGAVYRGKDRRLDRDVAIKLPHPELLSGKELTQRFLREAKAAASLRHPNIVPVYAAGQQDTQPYIASAFIPGLPLSDVLHDDEPFSVLETSRIVRKLSMALGYAHSQGIVHRDVKPSNVMLDRSREPQLMDFGLARLEGTREKLTQDGSVMGTPSYMAPEQARGKRDQIGPASDQYSVGVMLYEFLTGRVPFIGSIESVLHQVMNDEPEPIEVLRPDVPKDLAVICRKAMSKDPADRYPSCEDLAADLERFEEGEPILARPLTRFERLRRWTTRNPKDASLIGALVCAIAVGVSGVLWQNHVARNNLLAAEQNERETDRQTEIAKKQTVEAGKQANIAKNQAVIAQRNEQKANRLQLLAEERSDELQRKTDALQRKTKELEQRIYQSQVVAAEANLAAKRGLEAQAILNAIDDKSPAWDLRYLRKLAFAGQQKTFAGHKIGISEIALSTDGKLIASCSGDGMVLLRSRLTGDVVQSIKGHESPVNSITFSPDGTLVATGSMDKSVRVWSVESGMLIKSIRGHTGSVQSVRFSPDGKQVASAADDKTIRLFSLESGETLHTFKGHTFSVHTIDFSPNGKQLVSGSRDKSVRIWDVSNGQQIRNLSGHKLHVRSVAFTPDGRRIVSGSSYDNSLRLWDAESGKMLWKTEASVNSLAINPDGLQIVTGGSDKTVGLWSIADGKAIETLRGHSAPVVTVMFSADGTTIASGSSDSTVRTWAVEGGLQQRTIPYDRISLDRPVAFSPNGDLFVTTSAYDMELREVRTGKLVRTLKGHEKAIRSASFTPDGKQLLSGSADQTVRLWDVKTGKEVKRLSDDADMVYAVSISSNGLHAAAGSIDGKVRIWDRKTGQLLRTIPASRGNIYAVRFSPDGKTIASAGSNRVLRLWNTADSKLLKTMGEPGSSIYSIAFSPNGKLLATGSFDRTVRIWSTETGELQQIMSGHTDEVHSVAFSPDGRRIASASNDGSVRLWDSDSGLLLLILPFEGLVKSVAFDPSGDVLIAGANKAVMMWSADRSFPRDQNDQTAE